MKAQTGHRHVFGLNARPHTAIFFTRENPEFLADQFDKVLDPELIDLLHLTQE